MLNWIQGSFVDKGLWGSQATMAYPTKGRNLCAILDDSIRFMMLEEKVVKQIVNAEEPIAAQDDGIIDHLQKPLVGQFLQRTSEALKDANLKFVTKVVCLHMSQLHLQDKFSDHPLLFVRAERAFEGHLL